MKDFGQWFNDFGNEEKEPAIKNEQEQASEKKYELDNFGNVQAADIEKDDYLRNDYCDEGDKEDDAYERWREDRDNNMPTDAICYRCNTLANLVPGIYAALDIISKELADMLPETGKDYGK